MINLQSLGVFGCLAAGFLNAQLVYACSYEAPVISSICITAWTSTQGFSNAFMMADGRSLSDSDYIPLYAVIGETYGRGNGGGHFNIPNLANRFALGAGVSSNGTYPVGSVGGTSTTTVTISQLPSHTHTINASGQQKIITVSGSLTATTTLGSLAATTALGNVTANINNMAFNPGVASLQLNAAGSGTLINQPSGNALGVNAIYSASAPSTPLAPGSIGGSVNGALSGSAPLTMTGDPATTLSGYTMQTSFSGSPTASVSGNTGSSGGSSAFKSLPPYIALQVYIAYQGIPVTPN